MHWFPLAKHKRSQLFFSCLSHKVTPCSCFCPWKLLILHQSCFCLFSVFTFRFCFLVSSKICWHHSSKSARSLTIIVPLASCSSIVDSYGWRERSTTSVLGRHQSQNFVLYCLKQWHYFFNNWVKSDQSGKLNSQQKRVTTNVTTKTWAVANAVWETNCFTSWKHDFARP